MLDELILVTGATGYIASCLIPCLLEKGYRVRVLVRNLKRLQEHAWASMVEIVQGDLQDQRAVANALSGVNTAYYLVHNMLSGRNYEQRELAAAQRFSANAGTLGVQHIIYLGGLAAPDEKIGAHLRSRLQTGAMLRSGMVPVTEFRSCLIIGSGSISFEMIRFMTEQMPVILGPRQLNNLAQPIAVQDVVGYLLAALETPTCRGKVFEIGGGTVLPYGETMKVYARLRGLRRPSLLLPWVPAGLMAIIVGWLTPVPARIARPLIGGLRGRSIVQDDSARSMFPTIQPLSYESAVTRALDFLSPDGLEPVWLKNGALYRSKRDGFFIENRQVRLKVQSEAVYQIVAGLGGRAGWLFLDPLWKLRGLVDRLVGGPGMRGRNSAGTLSAGDVVDFYRVERVEPGRMLRLRAVLKAPGQGWMEWRTIADGDGVLFSQSAFFAPRGVWGYIYWYALWPIHTWVFAGLFRALARRAQEIPMDGGGANED